MFNLFRTGKYFHKEWSMMGWTIYLSDKNGTVSVPKHSAGSIIQVDPKSGEGTMDAEMSITYNYSGLYHLVLNENLSTFLHGKKAKDTVKGLKLLVEKLGTKQYERPRDDQPPLRTKKDFDQMTKNYVIDYWAPTMGNAGYVAAILLDWALLHPEAVWSALG